MASGLYNRSDCGYPNVRVYGWGGALPGSDCGYHLLKTSELNYIWSKYGADHNTSAKNLIDCCYASIF